MTTGLTVLNDIMSRRASYQTYPSGGHSHNAVEMFGGTIVPMMFAEPDPATFRGKYYYNTKINQLFKKRNSFPRWVRIQHWERVPKQVLL